MLGNLWNDRDLIYVHEFEETNMEKLFGEWLLGLNLPLLVRSQTFTLCSSKGLWKCFLKHKDLIRFKVNTYFWEDVWLGKGNAPLCEVFLNFSWRYLYSTNQVGSYLVAYLLVTSIIVYSAFNWQMTHPKDTESRTHDFCRFGSFDLKDIVKEVQ